MREKFVYTVKREDNAKFVYTPKMEQNTKFVYKELCEIAFKINKRRNFK